MNLFLQKSYILSKTVRTARNESFCRKVTVSQNSQKSLKFSSQREIFLYGNNILIKSAHCQKQNIRIKIQSGTNSKQTGAELGQTQHYLDLESEDEVEVDLQGVIVAQSSRSKQKIKRGNLKLSQRNIEAQKWKQKSSQKKFKSEYIEAEEFEILWWAELSSRLQRNQRNRHSSGKFPSAKPQKTHSIYEDRKTI